MSRSRQSGLSVIELMVAVTISLLILTGVVTMFVGSRSNYETTQRLSRNQENGRAALDQIVFDLRAAGFQGCARPNPASLRANEFAITTLPNPTELLWNYVISAQGFDGWTASSPPISVALNPPPNDGSNILVVRGPRRDEPALELVESQASPTDPLLVAWNAAATVTEGDTLMVSDCDGRAFFRVTGLASTAGGKQIAHDASTNASDTLLHPFAKGAEVVPMQTAIYYIGPSQPDPSHPDIFDPKRVSLWRKVGAGVPEEITEGIEYLEVRYGLDSVAGDARVDEYRTAAAVTDWSQVVSVSVALLARSPEPYGEVDPRQYNLLGTTVGPFPDRHQRQVFTATVALRNHVFD